MDDVLFTINENTLQSTVARMEQQVRCPLTNQVRITRTSSMLESGLMLIVAWLVFSYLSGFIYSRRMVFRLYMKYQTL